jgi:excinuclease ABC subunit C
MTATAPLIPPQTDLNWLRRRVANFAEKRPGVYRMVGGGDRVIYVGKAKDVRTRLLSYFRARYPEDKAARIIHATADIQWKYVPSEFAAYLEELRQIHRFRPVLNVQMNRKRRAVFIKATGGTAPKLLVGTGTGAKDTRLYGPVSSSARAQEAVRVLNDLLGLRDCALSMPMTYREQGDLFGPSVRAACLRHELGTCAGPCAGFVTEGEYGSRVQTALDFLEGRSIAPLDRVIEEMVAASDGDRFEQAKWWRDRFDILEWLFRASVAARSAIEALSFVYLDPGEYGDDRVYLIRRATVRAVAPAPHTPIEKEAFAALVAQHEPPEPLDGPLPASAIDEVLLLMRWFRTHPSALHRTVPISSWLPEATRRREVNC